MRTAEDKRAYMVAYRQAHKDKLREQSRTYHQVHQEESKQYAHSYYREHMDRVKANARRSSAVKHREQRLAVLAYYSGNTMACIRCGFGDVRALCLDHINGGGTAHRRRLGNGKNVWLWLARHGFPDGYQILCANCNAIKAREEGVARVGSGGGSGG